MPIVPSTETAPPASEDQTPNAEQARDYPEPQPPEDKQDDLASLLSMSDKELRMSFAGIIQACINSQPLYAAHNILDRDGWRQAVKEEAEYWIRYALNRARKDQ